MHAQTLQKNVIILSLLLPSWLTACKRASTSVIQHDIGRIADAGALAISCKPEEHGSLPVDQDYLAYLTDHIDYLIKANRAVLPPELTLSSLCPKILSSYEINASADPSGIVNGYRGLLWVIETDAQFAAVMAHELSHTASIHPFAPNQTQALAQDPQYIALCRGIRDVYSNTLTKEMATTNSAIAQLADYLDGIKPPLNAPVLTRYFAMYSPLVSKLQTSSADDRGVYSTILSTPFDPANRGIATRFDAEAALMMGVEDLLRMFQDQRQQVLAAMNPEQRSIFTKLEQPAMDSLAKLTAASSAFTTLRAQRSAKERTVLGDAVAANWSEQAADEKGLELFIRAGYDPEQFILMMQQLELSRGVPKEAIIEQAAQSTQATAETPANPLTCKISEHYGSGCDRGTASHPTSCWRVSDLRQELVEHRAEYAKIAPAQRKVSVFGNRLSRLKSQYYRTITQPTAPSPPQGG